MRWTITATALLWLCSLPMTTAGPCAASCDDCHDTWHLDRGTTITINAQLDCVAQFGRGSHAYIRNVTVSAVDDSKLLVTFANASDAPITKTSNVCYFDFPRPIAKNAVHYGDAAVFITCNNYWAPCTIRTRVAFACFVPCCYTETENANKPRISCVDGSTRTAYTTGRSVGYVDEEGIKFVDVPQCPSLASELVKTPSPMAGEAEAPPVRCRRTYEVGTAATGETNELLPRSRAMVCSVDAPPQRQQTS